MLAWTVWANRLSYRQKRHRCSHLRIIPSAEMKLLLLPSVRSYLHIFHNYQGCWQENWKQTQLTKYHHESGDAEEEYTFIVDLSSRSQRAQCWCRCTTARLACQSGRRGSQWKSTAEVCTNYTVRKERAAGVVPAFALLQKKSQVHFARASNTAVRSRQDQPESTGLGFCIGAWCTKHSQWLSVLVVSALRVALSVWRERELSFPMSVQCLCHS